MVELNREREQVGDKGQVRRGPDEIRSLFGEPVLSLVLEVTDGDRSKKIAYIEADALM